MSNSSNNTESSTMVRGNTPGNSFDPSSHGQKHQNEFNGHQGKWVPHRAPIRGFFPGPRRGMHIRAGFFPGPRVFPVPPQQFFNQPRKVRPHWTPRPRPPYFVSSPPEGFIPFPPPPPWPAPPPPQIKTEPDTTGEPPPKKKKRSSNCTSKPWDREAAERAHALEVECQKNANSRSIVIRFPDPELSKEIVQAFHPAIDNVHFQGPCGGRYCFVTLKDDFNVESVMGDLCKIKFGVGFLDTERKVQKPEENASHENIDPFSLYVGNLAPNISVTEVKEKFPSAARIDVGHAKKMKNTRYAFVKFATSEAALEAYKSSVNTIMASRSIIVRFRRHKAPVAPPTEKPEVNQDPKTEKLTVGAKLKAKKEKAKAEKAAREKEMKIKKKKETGKDGEDEEVEMENDESDSEEEVDETDAEDDDDDDGDEESEEEGYEEDDDGEGGDEDDDDDDDLSANIKEEDDEYMDDEDYKDIFTLTFSN